MNRLICVAVLCCGFLWASDVHAENQPTVADLTHVAVATAPAERVMLTMTPAVVVDEVTGVVVSPPTPPPLENPTLETGPIVDRAHSDGPSGDPVTFLREVYTARELAAGGPVTVTWSTSTGAPPALVPDVPARFGECLGAPRCVLIDQARWEAPGWRDSYDAMRVMIAHEWAHVLSFRYQDWLTPAQYFAFVPIHTAVDEECLADTIASIVLARGGFPPNETADYIVHYDCESFWSPAADVIRPQAEALAKAILEWASASEST